MSHIRGFFGGDADSILPLSMLDEDLVAVAIQELQAEVARTMARSDHTLAVALSQMDELVRPAHEITDHALAMTLSRELNSGDSDVEASRSRGRRGSRGPHQFHQRRSSASRSRSRERQRQRQRQSQSQRQSNRGVASASRVDSAAGVGDDCAICMCAMEASEKRCELDCAYKHVFHDKCIKPWLRRHHNCPKDRESVIRSTVLKASRS